MISVYITCRDMPESKRIAAKLLESKLIACANIFPVESMFIWEGKLKKEKEAAMFCKAKKENFGKIKEEVKKLHSYEVPCIVAFGWAESSKEFSDWVEASD